MTTPTPTLKDLAERLRAIRKGISPVVSRIIAEDLDGIAAALEAMPDVGDIKSIHGFKVDDLPKIRRFLQYLHIPMDELVADPVRLASIVSSPQYEEAKRWREAVNGRLKYMSPGEHGGYSRWIDGVLKNIWGEATGTPWQPPAPERVSDEELDDLLDRVSRRSSYDRADVERALIHYKELRQAERARRAGEQPR